MIEFDPEKDRRSEHGLPFVLAAEIFGGDYVETVDSRFDYGETRLLAVGMVASLGLLCSAVYTWRGAKRRIISFRRASARDRRIYRDGHTRGA